MLTATGPSNDVGEEVGPAPTRAGWRRRLSFWRSPEDQPRWARPALLGLAELTAREAGMFIIEFLASHSRSSLRGDMFIEAVVETPVNLTKRQQDLLREFSQEGDSRKTSPQSEGFFARVREFFEDLRE